MLLSLTLKNFKKHASLNVDFTDGLNGIYGPNYRGKSTILYGILFGLGGAPQVPGTRLARRDSDGKFSVELAFKTMTGVYRVTRTKSTANLHQQGEGAPLASGTTAVNDKIEELIGMTVRQWKELHFAKQKNAHSLLRYSANNLQQLMRRLVGAEELDGVQARLKRMADKEGGVIAALSNDQYTPEQCQAEVAEAERVIGLARGNQATAEQDLNELQAVEATGLAAIQKANDRLVELQEQKGAAETAKVRLQAAQRGLKEANDNADERQADLVTAQAKLAEAKEGYDPEADRKIAQFEGLKLRKAPADNNVTTTKTRLDLAKGNLEAADTALQSAVATLDQVKNEVGEVDLQGAEDEAGRAREAAAVCRQKVKDLEDAVAGGVCSTCNRPFDGHDPAQLELELSAARTKQAEAGDWVNDSQNALTRAKQQLKRVADAMGAAGEAEEKKKRAACVVQDCEGDHNDALDELAVVDGEMADLGLTDEIVTALRSQSQKVHTASHALEKAQAEHDRAQAALTAAETTLSNLKAKGEPEDPELLAAQIAKVTKQLGADRATMAELRETIAVVRTRLGSAKSDLANASTTLNRWMNALEQLKQNSDRRDKAEKRLAKIKHLQKHLKDNSEGYMGKVWASFLQQASQFVAQCTGGDIEALTRTDAGDFVFIEEGQEMQLEEASGAQEAIIGLAVQVSLSGAAPCHLNTVLLDEPTADMDPDCSLATMVAMKALGVQVIFVSHHQTDNALCDNAITL
jgi:DNA repair exonuclease SbcCD ATPase subunit